MADNLDDEQASNARLIIAIGREMKMSNNEILSGLMAAMQESSLRNIDYGDRDSIGLFQQRPSQGWGSHTQIMDPLYATRKYFSSLQKIKTRKTMSPTVMAQAVQRSAYPDAYAKWQGMAQGLMGQAKDVPDLPFPLNPPQQPLEVKFAPSGPSVLGDTGTSQDASAMLSDDGTGNITPAPVVGEGADPTGLLGDSGAYDATGDTPSSGSGMPSLDALLNTLGKNKNTVSSGSNVDSTPLRDSIIDMAKKAIGTPYVWGGENPGGFDCSGLIAYFYKRAGINNIPRTTYEMDTWNGGTSTGQDTKSLMPGDWVFLHPEATSRGQATWGHVAIWLGNGYILEAPHTGANVRIRKLSDSETRMGYHLNLGGDK